MTGGRLRLALLALALASACGSTVPLGAQATQQHDLGDGLGAVPTSAPGSATQGGSGSTSDGLGAVTTPGTTPGPRTSPTLPGAPAPDVDTSPVKLGILYTINDAAPGAGIDNGNTFTPEAAYKGLVKAWNARGGIAGRRIEPTYVSIRSSSSSIASDLEAACQTFTRDAKVAAVLASTGIYLESFSACLARASTPYIAGDYAFGDDVALAEAPGLVTPSTVTTDTRMRSLLERLVAAGRLTRSDKLGVVVESCAFDQRTYDRAVVPTAKRLGLTIADRVSTRCFSQIADLGGQAADMQNAVLQFASRGVTQVLFVSGSVEGNLMLYFATAAQAQAFHPHYALTSAVAAVVQEANTPKPQLANAAGLGWLPTLDRSADSPRTPAQVRCLADLRKGAGVTPASGTDRFFAFSVCDTFALYDAALRRTAGHSRQAEVLNAVDALGASFRPSSTPAADFRHGRRAGASQGRVFAWSTACGCFDYAGSSFSLR
jgi:hypothetical protein